MFSIFLRHQILSFFRSRNQAASIVARVFMALLVLYFLVVALGIGFFMNKVLIKAMPSVDPIVSFNGIILYYFLIDLLMRVQMQELPTLTVIPYLHLNIKKRTLLRFLNIRSLFSVFNFLPLFIFLPFIFTIIAGRFGTNVCFAYTISIIGLIIFNNFLLLYIKRKAISNAFYLIIGVVSLMALLALEYFKIISLKDAGNVIFSAIASQPALSLIFIVLPFTIYMINTRYLRENLYAEELSKKNENKVSTDYPFLNRFGRTGELAALELKLILRHKRSKSTLMMGALFLLYGFLIYKPADIEANHFGMVIFGAFFITGFYIISYGQFMFAWQSAHFDGLLSNKINFKNFIKAKFLLFTLTSTVFTLIASFYAIMSWKIVWIQLALYLYNIGFATVIVLFFATFNKKRLDISKGASFNWQGMSAVQWIMSLPLFAIPYLLFLPFYIYDKPFWGIAAIGIFGFITLCMRSVWINMLTKKFEKERYKIAEGFRE